MEFAALGLNFSAATMKKLMTSCHHFEHCFINYVDNDFRVQAGERQY